MEKNSTGLKHMNTRPSRNQRHQRNRSQSMLDMNKCSSSRKAKKGRPTKSESDWKQAACNWKRAGYNSKRAENSLKLLAEQARRRAPAEVRALRHLRSRPPSNTNMTSISMMNPNRDQMTARIHLCRFILLICVAGFLASCATNPPPLPSNNPADPHVHSGSRTPRNLLMQDETTVAIERELSATAAYAESAEKMEHDMKNMPGMQHGAMQGMQHEGMKMEGGQQQEHTGQMERHGGMEHGAGAQ